MSHWKTNFKTQLTRKRPEECSTTKTSHQQIDLCPPYRENNINNNQLTKCRCRHRENVAQKNTICGCHILKSTPQRQTSDHRTGDTSSFI